MHHDVRVVNPQPSRNNAGFSPERCQPAPKSKGAWYFLTGSVCLLLTAVIAGLTVLSLPTPPPAPVAPAPIITLAGTSTPALPIEYGPNQLFAQENFYAETLATFQVQKVSFVEANLSTMIIRYHEDGEVVFEAPILTKGREGSWWETPAGLYQVESKSPMHRSSFGNVDTRWNLVFQGNFFIHGWPTYPSGEPVASAFSGGCIRLSDEDAEALYKLVERNTPVLVYEDRYNGDDFNYTLTPPKIDATAFLVADVKSGSILLEHNAEEKLPIASITKLMTALIATEYINLDRNTTISQAVLATTSVPRLYVGQTLSNYSLLLPLLRESSNEAANALSRNLGPSRFVDLMNKKATSICMNNTNFADASGIDNENTATSYDLLQLATYLYHNRFFVLSLSSDHNVNALYTVYPFGALKNFNVVPDLNNFLGGKVGKTTAAKETILVLYNISVNGENRPIAFIVLGSEDNYKAVQELHAFVLRNYGDSSN